MTHQEQSIKLLAIDIDGTLLNSDHQLSARNEQALRAALDAGVQIVFATGKTRTGSEWLMEKLNVTTPCIFLQGLAIYNGDGKLRFQQTLDPQVARQVMTFAEDRGFEIAAYGGERILVRNVTQQMLDVTVAYHEPRPEAVGPLHNLVDEVPFNKLMLVGEPRAIKGLRWQLNAQLGGRCKLMQAGVAECLEVLPPGTSKGSALKMLLKDLQVPAAQVMAIGDGENDMEMLQLAGLGVAVANAHDGLKAIAQEVVASNDDDGLAEAIERFVLRRKLDETAPAADSVDAAAEAQPHSTEAAE